MKKFFLQWNAFGKRLADQKRDRSLVANGYKMVERGKIVEPRRLTHYNIHLLPAICFLKPAA